jgi:hypothetical protein
MPKNMRATLDKRMRCFWNAAVTYRVQQAVGWRGYTRIFDQPTAKTPPTRSTSP